MRCHLIKIQITFIIRKISFNKHLFIHLPRLHWACPFLPDWLLASGFQKTKHPLKSHGKRNNWILFYFMFTECIHCLGLNYGLCICHQDALQFGKYSFYCKWISLFYLEVIPSTMRNPSPLLSSLPLFLLLPFPSFLFLKKFLFPTLYPVKHHFLFSTFITIKIQAEFMKIYCFPTL